MNSLSRKLPSSLARPFVLVVIVVSLLAAFSIISNFKGSLSLSIGASGITLTVYRE